MKNAFFRSLSLTILALVLCCTSAVANEEYLSAYAGVRKRVSAVDVNEETTEIAVLISQLTTSGSPVRQTFRWRESSAVPGRHEGFAFTELLHSGQVGATLNSYVDSVLNEEFTITPADGGIRIDYLLGKRWPDDAYVPAMIRKEKFEAVLEKVEDKFDREILEEDYTLLTLVETAGDPYEKVNVMDRSSTSVWQLGPDSSIGPVLTRSYGLRDTPEERKKLLA